MKILKRLFFGISLACLGVGVFYLWAYDGIADDFFEEPYHLKVYPAPKTGAQLVVISHSDFHGDTNYFVAVRASKQEQWQPFFRMFADSKGNDWTPDYVGWSSDGTVVALGHNSPGLIRRLWDEGPVFFQVSDGFRAAYDLRFAKGYSPTPQLDSGASQQIAKLIQARGGWRLSNAAMGNRSFGSWRWEDSDFKALVSNFPEDKNLGGLINPL